MYTCTRIFVIHVHVLKAEGSGERKVNGHSSEKTSTAAPTAKPHPPEGVDQALLKTPPKRATGIIHVHVHTCKLVCALVEFFCITYPARKHTGKVGPRAVKKSPVRKSNGHMSSSSSPKTVKESSGSLNDNGDTNTTQGGTHTHSSPPSKTENESPQSEKENEADPEATSAQAVEAAVVTSMEADSANRDDDGSSKTEETAAVTPPPTKASSGEKKRDKKDNKKTKQKIHPFFGMYSSVLYALVYCSTVSYSIPLPKYTKFPCKVICRIYYICCQFYSTKRKI